MSLDKNNISFLRLKTDFTSIDFTDVRIRFIVYSRAYKIFLILLIVIGDWTIIFCSRDNFLYSYNFLIQEISKAFSYYFLTSKIASTTKEDSVFNSILYTSVVCVAATSSLRLLITRGKI